MAPLKPTQHQRQSPTTLHCSLSSHQQQNVEVLTLAHCICMYIVLYLCKGVTLTSCVGFLCHVIQALLSPHPHPKKKKKKKLPTKPKQQLYCCLPLPQIQVH